MKFLLEKKSIIIGIKNIKPDGWIHFNCESEGYFLVHYDQALYENLVSQQLQDFSPVDKQFFFHSQFLLVEHGYLDTRCYIELLKNLKEEINYYVWATVLKDLDRSSTFLIHY